MIATQDARGISLSGMEIPLDHETIYSTIPDIAICKPRLKYGLKSDAFCFVYRVPKAQLIEAATEREIPNLKPD